MGKFVDIHSHMLPGVDDGAANITESLQMLQEAYKSGTKDVILTPHYHPAKHYIDLPRQRVSFKKLKKYMGNDSGFRIYDGNEIYYSDNTIEMLKNGMLATLAESCYVLLEFSLESEYSYIENSVRALHMAGYWSVIAHAERYSCLRKPENIEELVY